MNNSHRPLLLLLSLALATTGCGGGATPRQPTAVEASKLVGAWRSTITFRTGPLAGAKDLEFLYAYNVGGTMTESSNYDEASNSSPPAYGVWREIDAKTFETKYIFFTTRSAAPGEGVAKNGDWWPAGHGVLTERITLADDGQHYTSTIKLVSYDMTGKPLPGDGEGSGVGARIVF